MLKRNSPFSLWYHLQEWSEGIGGSGPEQREGGPSVFEPLVSGGPFNFQPPVGVSPCFFFFSQELAYIWHNEQRSDTFKQQPTVWPVPYGCAQPYHITRLVAAMGSCFCLIRSHQHGIALEIGLRTLCSLPFTAEAAAKHPINY